MRILVNRTIRPAWVPVLTLVILVVAGPALAQGVSVAAAFGAGVFTASDENVYGTIKTDLYPEILGQVGIGMFRLGARAGLIYRKLELYQYDPYSYGDLFYETTMAFIPIQGELLVAPFDGDPNASFYPYFGLMGGVFLAVGDNSSNFPAYSAIAGADVNAGPFMLYGDLRYTYAKGEPEIFFTSESGDITEPEKVQYGGVMVVVGLGVRFGGPEKEKPYTPYSPY